MRTCAYIAILVVLAMAFISGCGEKEIPSDTDQTDIAKNDIAKNDIAKNDVAKNDVDQNDIAKNDVDQSNIEQSDIEQSDIDILQGTWEIISVEQMGKPTGTFANHKVLIKDNTLTFMRGEEPAYTGIITLDASKQPKTLDMELIADKESKLNGRVSQGIYVVEGDTFKWCNAAPGVDDRPGELSTNEEKNHMLLVLKREKK